MIRCTDLHIWAYVGICAPTLRSHGANVSSIGLSSGTFSRRRRGVGVVGAEARWMLARTPWLCGEVLCEARASLALKVARRGRREPRQLTQPQKDGCLPNDMNVGLGHVEVLAAHLKRGSCHLIKGVFVLDPMLRAEARQVPVELENTRLTYPKREVLWRHLRRLVCGIGKEHRLVCMKDAV